jgi:hypothetical protein
VHAGERSRRDHRLQDLDRVVLDDPHIAQLSLFDPLQERADAGRMNLDREEIDVGARRRDRRRAAPIPKPISTTSGATRPNSAATSIGAGANATT